MVELAWHSYENYRRLRETGVLIGDVAQPEGALRRGEPGRPEGRQLDRSVRRGGWSPWKKEGYMERRWMQTVTLS